MKIAIIGYGWLGLPLAKKLKGEGLEVMGTTTSSSKVLTLNSTGMKTYEFSGHISEELKTDLLSCSWIVLTIPPSSGVNYPQLLKRVAHAISSECKVIFTSSIGVYQEQVGLVSESAETREDHPVLQAEKQLSEILKNRLTILRLGGLIGADRHPVKYLAGRIGIEGAENPVNLIHLDDVIEAVRTIIHGDHSGELFNLVYPEHPSKKEYYSNVAKHMNLPEPKFAVSNRTGKIVDAKMITKKTNFTYSKSIF